MITITVTEISLIQVLFFTFVSKQKIKNTEFHKTEYRGTLIPFENQLHSKPERPIFLFFRSWSLVLYVHL